MANTDVSRRRLLRMSGTALAGIGATGFAAGVQGSPDESNEYDFDPNDPEEVEEFVEWLEKLHERHGRSADVDPLQHLNKAQKKAVADRIGVGQIEVNTTIGDVQPGILNNEKSISRSVTAHATAGNKIWTFTHEVDWAYDGDEILDYYNHNYQTHMAFWSFEGLASDIDTNYWGRRRLERIGEFQACVLKYGCLQNMTGGAMFDLYPNGYYNVTLDEPDPIEIPWI